MSAGRESVPSRRLRDSGIFRTNELGLRDEPYRADADLKILVLGDSITWGNGIDDIEDLYPKRLQRKLAQHQPNRSVFVINSGVPGYSTFQEAAYLKLRGLALRPNLVVLQFCLNDIVERYNTLAQYGGDNVFLGVDTRIGGAGIRAFLIRHSRAMERLFRFAQRRARGREEYDVGQLTKPGAWSPALEEAWALVVRELEEVRLTTKQAGIPLLLVIAPYASQLTDPEHTRQPQDRLIAYARSHGVAYIDLLPDLVRIQQAQPALRLFIDANHFTVPGHLVLAELLAEPVRRLVQ